MSTAKVAIVIVDYKGWRDTINCIVSCLTLEDVEYRIIVCDNDPSSDSRKHIKMWALSNLPLDAGQFHPIDLPITAKPTGIVEVDRASAEDGSGNEQVVLASSGGNLGFAGGNNIGIRWALAQDFTHVWLLNNDTVVQPNTLRKLIDQFDKDQNLGLCGSVLLEYHEPEVIQALGGAINTRNFKGRHLGYRMSKAQAERLSESDVEQLVSADEVYYPVGASMVASRAFLERIGLMDEDYFLYYEETDWVLRARGNFRVGVAMDSFVFHKHGASAGTKPSGESARSTQYLFRSRVMAARKFDGAMGKVWIGIADEVARAAAKAKFGKALAAFRVATGKVVVPPR